MPASSRAQRLDDVLALIDQYVADVLAGRRVVGRLERLAVERHARDLERVERGEAPGLRFDPGCGAHALEFVVRRVRHSKGEWAGKRFRFTSRSSWQAFALWSMFGWQRKRDDGRWARRFRYVYVSVARKNGKSMIAAVVLLYMLAFDGEGGAECFAAATKRDQAKIVWTQAAGIVRKDPELRKKIRVIASRSHMYVIDDPESYAQALGRDQDSHDGLNPHLAVVDEFHAHKDGSQRDVLQSGQGARIEPMMLVITTAGSKRTGPCWEDDDTAARVLEGTATDDTLFAFIARPDEDDDPELTTTLQKANPNLGESVYEQAIRDDLRAARNAPGKWPEFRRKRLNLWTEESLSWLGTEVWDACAGDVLAAELAGQPCVVAIDVSAVQDYTAAVACWLAPDGLLRLKPRLWIPGETLIERERTDRVPVAEWVRQGWVERIPGAVIDQDAIKQYLVDLRERHDIRKVAIDPYNGWKLATDLMTLGFEVEHFRQGWATMSPAMKETERRLLSQTLQHDSNPAMRWMFANVAAVRDSAGNVKPDKDRSANRIDGPVAAIMAVGVAAKLEDTDPGIGSWVISA